MSKWNAAKGFLNWGKSKVSPTITSVKGKYNVGSADKIKKKSNVKKLKSEIESFLGKDIYKSDAETTAAKLKKTTEETKRYLLNLPPKK